MTDDEGQAPASGEARWTALRAALVPFDGSVRGGCDYAEAVAARKSLALALSERFERELVTGQFASIIGRRDDSEMLEKVIAGDGQLEREVTNLCRLIETIAQSLCSGDADENVIVSRVGLEISFIVATLRPWVEEKRRKAGNPHLFETAEWLVDSMVDV